MKNCAYCKKEIRKDKKFCSSSCSANYNNENGFSYANRRRHPFKDCPTCGKLTNNNKYCSMKCVPLPVSKYTPEEQLKRRRLKNLLAVRKYQARRENQMPDGVDMDKMRTIYENCPSGYEVDHIIPISKGGLHCPSNLQYLPMRENRRKGNKLNWTSSSTGRAPSS